MRLATFNVNSVRKRAPGLRRFLEAAQPDLVFLQELKCKTEEFPAAEFEGSGYRFHAVGQQGGRNGVAVLGRIPFEVTAETLPGEDDDAHARYVEVTAEGIDIAGIYLPNGNSGGDEGFAYKLRWMERLRAHAAEKLDAFRPFAILGDFNVCPTELDLAPRALPPTDALVRPETRAAWRALENLGLMDALRALHPGERLYTYWDYGPAFEANRGLRIDHALLSPELAERLSRGWVDAKPRSEESPSDHTPVLFELS
ncbi:exodeoxyribonuclease III [Pseudoroseomonas deserti]|uniref:Exodeoxyribonuclease III n=1 Tax=Teichococcus deserti TaxID=1817963 RepID=A0A1V2H117_9PROT|nr:exodeoxyribonuclease III [Pseudoroseomonas deserti]ONG51875.1 exodeoxyribonuclease III [Pseudoroseomonas deserti]